VSYYHLTFETGSSLDPKPVSIIRITPDEAAAPRKALEILRAGGLVVFPVEDGYVVGCSAADPVAVRRLCEVTGAAPERLTTLVGTREQADGATGAVRWPRHPVALALARDSGSLAATSCIPGAPAAPTPQQVVFVLGDAVDLVLDAGVVGRHR
jgi:tRNA A37 threonylcarbamoyladenosine synthetase subunit TsaC/SUA5/YrdC